MFLSSMSERMSSNDVAQKFNEYMIQAIHRVCPVTSVSNRGRSRAPYWYDHECRTKRSHAIGCIRLSVSTVNRTYELSGITHVTPFRKYGKHSTTIAAGARVQSASDRGKHLVACREYRACVQRKKRNFRHKNVQHVTQILVRDKAKLWKALDRMGNTFRTKNGPDGQNHHQPVTSIKSMKDKHSIF